MSHQPDPEHVALALHAVGEVCLELAKEGCQPSEVATALAAMLGVVTAAIDCCEEHAASAEDTVVEIFEENLALHRARWEALERVGPAGLHYEGGHA